LLVGAPIVTRAVEWGPDPNRLPSGGLVSNVRLMRRRVARSKRSGAAWVLVCAAVLALAPAAAAEPPPDATTGEVTEITADAATLTGTVNPHGSETTYRFEYGVDGLDSQTAPAPAGAGSEPVAVSVRVTNLAPDTTYRVRLVAYGPRKDARGREVTFRTASAPPAPAPSPVAAPPASAPPLVPLSPTSNAFGAPPPVFGERVNVVVRSGVVSVDTGGGFEQIRGFASVPVGSRLSARRGTLSIISALPPAAGAARAAQAATPRTQTGIFHGGLFDVLQPREEGGMVELRIRGRQPRCRRTVAVGKKKRSPRSLWGNVRKGNFRIRGGNSVAAVRGTRWYVEDRCDGTVTRVSRGSVRVRDLRRGRTVVVRAGQSYLARDRR
jgi:hypothetical protein